MKTRSLVPYLENPEAPFSLRIQTWGERVDIGSRPDLALVALEDRSSGTRTLPGRVVSDAGGEVARVLLVMTADDHPLWAHETPGVSNPEVDEAFLEVYEWMRDRGQLVPLASRQVGGTDRAAMGPLFVCTRTGRFASPLCPACGRALELVTDDRVLDEARLPSYSMSLERYLACRQCLGEGRGRFYAAHRRVDDPPCVSGVEDVVAGMAVLDAAGNPCASCAERSACHGGGEVTRRIVPVSFYPFRLFVLPDANIVAEDFLELASGAPVSQVCERLAKRGQRIRKELVEKAVSFEGGLHLFEDGPGRFAETLLLKVSLMRDVAALALAPLEGKPSSVYPPGLEQVWLHLPAGQPRLATLWHYRLASLGVHPRPTSSMLPASQVRDISLLGLLWFDACISSKEVGRPALHDALVRMASDGRLAAEDPLLDAGNVFWEKAGVEAFWMPLWERALKLGWSLLSAGPEFPRDAFVEECGLLVDDLRRSLVRGVAASLGDIPSPGRGRTVDHAADSEIAAILGEIRSAWAGGVGVRVRPGEGIETEAGGPRAAEGAHADLDATLAAASGGEAMGRGAGAAGGVLLGEPPKGDDFSTETVIVRSSPRVDLPRPDIIQESGLDETMAAGPSPAAGAPAGLPAGPGGTPREGGRPVPAGAAGAPQTVQPAGARRDGVDGSVAAAGLGTGPVTESDLDETVIVGRVAEEGLKASKTPARKGDDALGAASFAGGLDREGGRPSLEPGGTQTAGAPQKAPSVDGPGETPGLDETVVVGGRSARSGHQAEPRGPADAAGGKGGAAGGDVPGGSGEPRPVGPGDREKSAKGRDTGQGDRPAEGEGLEETVIIKPRKP